MQAKSLAKWFPVIAVGASLLVGCSDNPEAKARQGYRTHPDGTPVGSSGGPVANAPTCPADIAAPTHIATDPDAADVRIAGDAIYFRVGTKLVRVEKDGGGRKDVYTSPDLIRTFTDGKTIAAVESPTPPNAVLRVGALGAADLPKIGTDLVAAATTIFSADATSLYAIADTDGGDNIYKIAKDGTGGVDTVAETKGVVSDAQLVGGAIWYVRDQTEIYKLAPGGDGSPTRVATVTEGCSLAVGATHLYCSANGVIDERDLAGANPKKLFDEKTSRVPVPFGAAVAAGETVVVRSSGAGPLKHVLRSVGGGTERVLACGRDVVGGIAVDGAAVAWVEAGRGVFFTTIR